MSRLLIKTGLLYMVSYLVFYLITLSIILALGSKMSGLFRWFVLAAAVIPAGYYYSVQNPQNPTFDEKSFLIAFCLVVTFIIDNLISMDHLQISWRKLGIIST
jgi:hypothetical protein